MTRYDWPRDTVAARDVQNELRNKVRLRPLSHSPSCVAGVDAAFAGERVIAAASLFTYPSLALLSDAFVNEETRFPYIPGFLSFREGHAFIRAVRDLKQRPDLIIVDGQGIAHPLGLGIASHIGVLLGIPSIGCAKTRLIGEYDEPGIEKGQWSPLIYKGEQVGAVLRTRHGVRPLFVSPGHLIDLTTSIEVVLNCLTGYRLPEPVRRADHLSKALAAQQGKDT